MNVSLRDLQQKVDAVEMPFTDVASLVAEGERRLRRRRWAVTAGGVAAVLAAVVGGAQLTDLSGRAGEPVRPGPTTPSPTPAETLVIPDGQVSVIPEIGEADLSGWTLGAQQTNERADQFSDGRRRPEPRPRRARLVLSGSPAGTDLRRVRRTGELGDGDGAL